MPSNSDVIVDKRQIKKKICQNSKAPLPRCPHKSFGKMKKLKAAGDLSHEGRSHYCHLCSCNNEAGRGTSHVGYGWCSVHERLKTPEKAEHFAQEHLRALQGHNPFIYTDGGKYLSEMVRISDEAKEYLDLKTEITVARSHVQELISHAVNGTELNEYVQGHKKTMSDKTRMELVNKLMNSVAKLEITKHTIDKEKMISMEEFRYFVGRYAKLCREFIDNDDEWLKFVQEMKVIGEPIFK